MRRKPAEHKKTLCCIIAANGHPCLFLSMQTLFLFLFLLSLQNVRILAQAINTNIETIDNKVKHLDIIK